jgi:Family of unknown function (DUF5519)
MDVPSLTAAVRRELLALPGVTEGAHRFGGVVFHLGRHELGHLHGETVADIPLAPQFRDELLAGGRVSAAEIAADSAWLSRSVDGPQDVASVVELFRLSYEYAAAQPALAVDEQAQDAPLETDRQSAATWRDLLVAPSRRLLSRRRHPRR